MSSSSLAAPLARALEDPDEVYSLVYKLRADPATVVAIAEALNDLDLHGPESHDQTAAALADALFGAKP